MESVELYKETTDKAFSRVVMLVLSIFPILNYYQGPLFSYGIWLFVFLIIIKCIREKKINVYFFPKSFIYYWSFLAVALIIVARPLKITYLIPGGLGFFVWALILGFVIKYFNLFYFRKYARFIVILCGIVIVLQELMFFSVGSRFNFFLRLSNELTIGIPYHELVNSMMYGPRSSALFSEPAHFAQYILPLLAIELFSSRNIGKFLTPFSVFIIFILIVLRSGNGFVGLMLLLIIKTISYFKERGSKSVLLFLILIPIAVIAFQKYASTEVGSDVLSRTEELENDESSASYIRIFRGYVVYDGMPTMNKLIGTTQENLKQMNIPMLHIKDDELYDLYFNGLQNVLIYNGIIGLLFLAFFYYKQGKEGTIMAISEILLLLVLSLLGQVYLSYTMLFCTAIAVTQKKYLYEK